MTLHSLTHWDLPGPRFRSPTVRAAAALVVLSLVALLILATSPSLSSGQLKTDGVVASVTRGEGTATEAAR